MINAQLSQGKIVFTPHLHSKWHLTDVLIQPGKNITGVIRLPLMVLMGTKVRVISIIQKLVESTTRAYGIGQKEKIARIN